MKRLPILISLLALATVNLDAIADTEFVDSVPVEVVKRFVTTPYGGEGKLFSDILDAFPPFTMPPAIKVLASADQGIVQRVILSSTLEEDEAGTAVIAAFADEGWMQLPVYGGGAQQTGFVSAEQSAIIPRQLCHDVYGMLTMSTSADSGISYVSLGRNVRGPGMGIGPSSCSEMLARTPLNSPTMGIRAGNMLNNYVPKLLMPQSNTTTPMPPMSSISSGGGGSMDWEARGALAIDWRIGEIYEHFATQIAEQGWSADSSATGAMVATGSWTKNIDNMDLVGSLSIHKLADDTWDLRFRLIRQGGAQGGPGTINGVRSAVDQAQ